MRARSASKSRAVDTTRGAAAAVASGTPGGTSTVTPAAATATSARPPPGVNAATRSPTCRSGTPLPTERMVPATSRPGTYGQAEAYPGSPRRAMTSMKLTPA
jgi:hypothetical protein